MVLVFACTELYARYKNSYDDNLETIVNKTYRFVKLKLLLCDVMEMNYRYFRPNNSDEEYRISEIQILLNQEKKDIKFLREKISYMEQRMCQR